MVDLFGVEGFDDADVIGDLADLRKDIADHLPAFSMTRKVVLGTEAFQLVRLALKLGNLLPLGDRLRHRLAVHLSKLRFVVERFEMRGTSGHVEPDHALAFRRDMNGQGIPGPFGAEGILIQK